MVEGVIGLLLCVYLIGHRELYLTEEFVHVVDVYEYVSCTHIQSVLDPHYLEVVRLVTQPFQFPIGPEDLILVGAELAP